MLELAKQQQWEALAQAQGQRVKLISEPSPGSSASLPADPTSEAQAIREIQSLDSEILAYVTPWRADVAKLLSHLAPPQ